MFKFTIKDFCWRNNGATIAGSQTMKRFDTVWVNYGRWHRLPRRHANGGFARKTDRRTASATAASSAKASRLGAESKWRPVTAPYTTRQGENRCETTRYAGPAVSTIFVYH